MRERKEPSEDTVDGAIRTSDAKGWPKPTFWLTLGTSFVVGALLVYEGVYLGVFHGLNELDDGVYFGEGAMLAHGLLPYRSYLDVQPPGIALLMAPFGLLGRLIGDRVAFEFARVFVTAVTVLNVI